jgi:hypothetical protein
MSVRVPFLHCAWILLIGAFCRTPVRAADENSGLGPGTNANSVSPHGVGPEAAKSSEPEPTAPAAPDGASSDSAETPPAPSLAAGVDVYAGTSNQEGFRRYRDGFWAAGSGLAYPSNIYLRWKSRGGADAKVALGLGKMYLGADRDFDQPVEAWYQKPAGQLHWTVGKYYVPFAIQEWQYETKWGVMVQTERGAYNLAASANYNPDTNSPNAYFRVGRDFGENINVGISLAAGKGLSYGSIHDRAAGLDVSAAWRGWRTNIEYLALRRTSAERFRFGYIRLAYEKLGKFKPYIARYSWNDTTDAFGQLDSTSIGLNYQLTPYLALEGGRAFTSDKDVWWLQAHLAAEQAVGK